MMRRVNNMPVDGTPQGDIFVGEVLFWADTTTGRPTAHQVVEVSPPKYKELKQPLEDLIEDGKPTEKFYEQVQSICPIGHPMYNACSAMLPSVTKMESVTKEGITKRLMILKESGFEIRFVNKGDSLGIIYPKTILVFEKDSLSVLDKRVKEFELKAKMERLGVVSDFEFIKHKLK